METRYEKTPLWNEILRHQLVTQETIDVLEILLGRLFYQTGKYDNWQVIAFIRGDAGTGKSTILDLVRQMFPPGSVGCIGARTEAKFGLDVLSEKRHVQIPDTPLRMSSVLDQTDFQSMITGEPVNVPQKHKKAMTAEWKTPLIMAGNVYPDYVDKSGSITRRIAMFLFENLVTKSDPRIKDKMVKDELIAVMLRCITKYRNMADTAGGVDFWDWAPPGLKENKKTLSLASDPLAEFLANGDDLYQILHSPGHVTTLVAFKMAFSKHMEKVHNEKGAKLGTDYHAIVAAGFIKSKQNMCKVCYGISTKAACGDHYDGNNRASATVFENMLIHRRQ
jgi:hypothetical protein